MLELARLHLLVDDLDGCQQQCTQLLEMDKDNDSAFMVNLNSITVTLHLVDFTYFISLRLNWAQVEDVLQKLQ